VDLVGRLRPGLYCASPGNSQQPDRLDGSRGRLRGADRLTGEHGSCGCLGIGRVGLAALSAGLAVRSVHLDHLHAGIGQKPGQPGTPRAGAFHSDRAELAESAQPPEQRSISAESRRELLGAEHPAQLVDSHANMEVLVCVDATSDKRGRICHLGVAIFS
jgi:hypothetical protein